MSIHWWQRILLQRRSCSTRTLYLTHWICGAWKAIPAIAEHYGIKDNYIRIGTARQLFTRHPQTGELRGSMFFLPDDAPEPPELTRFLRFLKANEVFLKQWCEAHPVRGDLQECNARFRTAYAEYLNSIRNTYALTDEDIDFWLF